MADQYVQVAPNSTGLKVDTSELTVGANTVERQRMVIADPTVAANLATVSSGGALKVDASASTQPVSGAVNLAKRTQILTTTPLTGSATYTSAWQDTALTGTNFVALALFSTNVSIAFGNWTIQETDDSATSSMFRTANATGQSTANVLGVLSSQIKARYWRVIVVNGATAMTGTFELTATESNSAQQVTLVDPLSNGAPTVGAFSSDGQSVFNSGLFTGAFGFGFNGTAWDRIAVANVGTNVASATKGAMVVQGSSSGQALPVSVATLPALAAGTNSIGTVQPGNTPNTTPWLTTQTPSTSGGLSTTKLISAASTNATSLKASAGQVYNIQAFNTNAAARYLKLYNKASSPTVGTDTPVNTFLIPGNATGAGCVIEISNGLAFATGIAFAITGAMADSDTTAVGASDVVVNIQYK